MVLVTLSFLFSAPSSDTIQSMRYANSLESLDAVSTSIQQGAIHILRQHFFGFLVPPPPLHKCMFFSNEMKVTNFPFPCNLQFNCLRNIWMVPLARAQSSQLHHQIEAAHNGVRYFMNSHLKYFFYYLNLFNYFVGHFSKLNKLKYT